MGIVPSILSFLRSRKVITFSGLPMARVLPSGLQAVYMVTKSVGTVVAFSVLISQILMVLSLEVVMR